MLGIIGHFSRKCMTNSTQTQKYDKCLNYRIYRILWTPCFLKITTGNSGKLVQMSVFLPVEIKRYSPMNFLFLCTSLNRSLRRKLGKLKIRAF